MIPRHLPLWWPLVYGVGIAVLVFAIAWLQARKEDREFWKERQ